MKVSPGFTNYHRVRKKLLKKFAKIGEREQHGPPSFTSSHCSQINGHCRIKPLQRSFSLFFQLFLPSLFWPPSILLGTTT